ncbi:MAG TPA: pilus assembly protein PilM [Atribacteraceae bacterium]|nr:pilus assembly protein PilM [Atribacteraceae bacterium]
MLGVDLGSYSLKYCLSRKKRDMTFAIEKTGDFIHNGEMSADGNIRSSDSMANTIRNVWKKNRLSREICLSYYHPRMVVQNISLPEMSASELENALRWEAGSIITGEDRFQIGWEILGKADGKMEILFTATPAAAVAEYLSLFKTAGIRVEAMEPHALSLIRGFLGLHPAFSRDTSLVLVETGFRKSTILYFENGKLVFVRYFGWGLQKIWEVLKESHGLLPAEILEMFKRGSISEDIPYQMEEAIAQAASDLLSEINRSFSFFLNKFGEHSLKNCFLVGGGAGLLSLRSYLVNNLNIALNDPSGPPPAPSLENMRLLPAIGVSLWS